MAFFQGRNRGNLRRLVQRGLASEPRWQLQLEGRWLCPFCGTLALKVPQEGSQLVEAVLEHLDGPCPNAAGGEGTERSMAELQGLASAKRLRRFVKTRLAAHEYPRRLEFVEALPMTATGKIMRRELRQMEVSGGSLAG